MALTAKKVYAILKRQISDMEAKIKTPIIYRGTVATADLLPENPKIGDMYNIESKSVYGEAGMNVAWNGVVWDTMGAPIDMSLYIKSSELADWVKQQNKPAYTAEEVGALPADTKIPSKTSDLQNDSGFLTKIPDNYLSETDKTLSVSGEAADAKVTGEKIAKNSSDITKKLDKNQGVENSGKIAGINETGDIVPMFPMGVEYSSETNCLEFGADQKMKLNQGIGLDSSLTKTGYAADAGVVGEVTSSLKEDLGDIEEVTVSKKYIDGSAFGELKQNYNVQINSTATSFYIVDDAADNYYCMVGDVSNKKYIKAVGTIGNSYQYTSIAIFVDENLKLTGYVYDSSLPSVVYEEKYIKVPSGSKTVYINAIKYGRPELYETSRKYIPSSYSKEEIDEKMVDVNILTETILEKPELSTIDGYFIAGASGKIIENVDFAYTSPIALKKGDRLQIQARGYLTNVAIVSKTDASNSNHIVKVRSDDNVYKKYTYTVKEDGYYCFCGNMDSKIEVYVIKANTALIEKPYCDLSIFRKFGVIGDSYASGELYYSGAYHDKYFNSWGQVMARKHGTVCTNYSSGGLHTRSWLTAAKGLPLLLANEPEDAYYLALGINDYYVLGESYLGSIKDITDYSSYSDYGDTFYGNYGRIIEQIRNHAPNSKLVMFTCASTEEVPQKFNNAIIEIANHYELPYAVQAEDDFFQSTVYTNMAGGHPTSIAYSGMALALERLLINCIVNNMSYFFDMYMYD